ncbi:hypothetical protein [Desulfopila sp. IMCC35006]|uniref:hypothetical protein n=1 Tax=Desulfopila sp. IMCC35006 TaxID=2569542 RepID=UPI00142F0A89|nr:hypothetical protein [Desulfopila sp. IMCC35006]
MNKNIDISTGMKIFAGTIFGKKDFAGIFIAVTADIKEAKLYGTLRAERYSAVKL